MVYVVLLRGINVGGKNKVPMADLKLYLEEMGFEEVVTYIQSGNAILRSNLDAATLAAKIEAMLPQKFKLDSSIVRTLVIEYEAYKNIVLQTPEDFGKDSDNYRYNVLFLMGVSSAEAMEQITAREGVDRIWPGDNVIYFRNSIADASKSRLSRITQQPVYQSLTIRNWNTTSKLLQLLDERKS